MPAGLRLLVRPDNGGFAVGVNAGWNAARSPWLLGPQPGRGDPRGIPRPGLRAARPLRGPGQTAHRGSSASACSTRTALRRARSAPSPRWAGRSASSSYRASRRKYQPAWRIRAGRVDWVTGACMLVNADADRGGRRHGRGFLPLLRGGRLQPGGPAAGLAGRLRPERQRGPPTSLAKSGDFAQDAGHHPAQQAALFPQALAALAVPHLAAIVRLESAIRGVVRPGVAAGEEARAWAAIGEVARRMRRGEPVRGRDVVVLADRVSASCELPVRQVGTAAPGVRLEATGDRRTGDWHHGPRKDGSA